MNELIELNPTEQFLANTNINITLKEIADKYEKRHDNLMRDFKKMVVEVSDNNLNALKFEVVDYSDKKGELRQTYSLDLKTMVWFVAKFDHNLRLTLVNFAFEKLEKEKSLAINEAVKIANKPKTYKDGRMSVRGCIAEVFNDIEEDVLESDVWDALVFNGLAETRAKVTIKRVVPDTLDGIVGSSKESMATYRPDVVRSSYDKWLSAGKPVKSEYEKLQEEFSQVSKYYKDKMEEAKR